MSKDRFKELQENIEKYGDGVDISIINHFAVIDMEAPFLDDFFNQAHALRNSITKLAGLIEDVEYLQHIMLAPQIIIGMKAKLEKTMTEVKLLGHQIRKELNHMKQIHENRSTIRKKHICQRVIEFQIETLTKNFCALMDEYYQSIIIYRDKCKERVQRQCRIAGFAKTDEEIEEMLETGCLMIYPEIIIETKKAKQQFDLMKLRRQELVEIENSILELYEMFFDVSRLVDCQGDEIDYIADRTKDAEEGVKKWDPIISSPKKVSHCFPLKLSKKRFASSFARVFSSCI